MGRKLSRTVMFVDHETGELVTLRAGTVPPEQYADRIGSQNFATGEVEAEEPATEPEPETESAADGDGAEAEPEPQTDDKPSPVEGNIDEVLDRVGDDPAKAQAALDAEQAKGDKARSTLIEKLTAVTAGGSAS